MKNCLPVFGMVALLVGAHVAASSLLQSNTASALILPPAHWDTGKHPLASLAVTADEPLIPAALNAVLLKIHPGLTTNEVTAVLSPAYPKVSFQMGDWSGHTGYIDYKLDDRFTLSVSSITRGGKMVIHDDLLMYIYDWPAKRRVDLKVYCWEQKK
jgi:hypothetical protein